MLRVSASISGRNTDEVCVEDHGALMEGRGLGEEESF